MNLDELRSVQVEERKTDSLQPLRESFYSDVAEFIAGLREERERAAAGVEDPFASTDVRELSDEIETAEEVVQAIYERRVGKVVKRASLAAAGIPTDEEGLTAEEAALFETLVAEIEANRRTVLDILGGTDTDSPDGTAAGMAEASDSAPDQSPDAGEDPTDEPSAPEPPPEESLFDAGDAVGATDRSGPSSSKATQPGADDDMTASEHTSAAVEHGPGSESSGPAESPTDGSTAADEDVERISVRITQDVGEILGIDDHTYVLSEDDVVTLPTANAEPLIDRNAAEPIE